MKNLLYMLIALYLPLNLHSQTFTPVNFEGAGYVTGIYEQRVVPNPTWSIEAIYAKTDIGGLYKSTNEGDSWHFISQFASSPAGLMVQGFAVNYLNTIVISCGTDYLDSDSDRGIWRSTNSGQNWEHVLSGVNFGGNVFHSKIGGECIIHNPNNHYSWFAGGRAVGVDTLVTIYKSESNASTWNSINKPADLVKGNVSSIVMNPSDSNEIWVATDMGIWVAVYNLGKEEWEWYKMKTAHPTNPVYRIVIKQNDTLFATQGKKLFRTFNGGTNWTDITSDFDNGYAYGGDTTIMVDVKVLADGKIFASRIAYPSKISTNNGTTFGSPIEFDLNTASNPKHALTLKTNIFYARTNFLESTILNTSHRWFASGGAGPYRSEDDDVEGEWEYMVNGINMPVIYDVTFGYGTSGNAYIYVPLADWTMARIEKSYSITNGMIDVLDYAREETGSDADISNATRTLVSPDDPSSVYLVGGNLYTGYNGAFFYSDDYGATYTEVISNLGLHNMSDHPIIDALVSDDNADDILILVGHGTEDVAYNTSNTRGIYRSTNGGLNFTAATGINGSGALVSELFTHQKNLAKTPWDGSKKYCYLEAGGFFISENSGSTWSDSKTNPDVGYLDKGCIGVDESGNTTNVFLAIYDQGLFLTDDDGENWSNVGGFESAKQVVCRGDVVYVFGNSATGDGDPDMIYRSTNGGSTFDYVVTNSEYYLPSTCHLTIDPDDDMVIWVSTSGQGVYRIDTDPPIDSEHLIAGDQGSELKFQLNENYPNPFNPSTQISFTIPNNLFVSLKVYDILGKEVANLVNERKNPGHYSVNFNASNLSSGVYFYKLDAGNHQSIKKMVLLK